MFSVLDGVASCDCIDRGNGAPWTLFRSRYMGDGRDTSSPMELTCGKAMKGVSSDEDSSIVGAGADD